MRSPWPVFVAAPLVALLACSGGGGGAEDAAADPICIAGTLRCDEDGGRPNWLQQCNPDGTGWDDLYECELCHDGTCYGRLDASSD
jgi:hypothetical protein